MRFESEQVGTYPPGTLATRWMCPAPARGKRSKSGAMLGSTVDGCKEFRSLLVQPLGSLVIADGHGELIEVVKAHVGLEVASGARERGCLIFRV